MLGAVLALQLTQNWLQVSHFVRKPPQNDLWTPHLGEKVEVAEGLLAEGGRASLLGQHQQLGDDGSCSTEGRACSPTRATPQASWQLTQMWVQEMGLLLVFVYDH